MKPSTLIRDRPERGEEQEVFQGESDELSHPNPFQVDSTISLIAITWNPVKLHMPREESVPIPLKYIDVTRNTHTSLNELLEKNIDDY